MNKPFLAAVLGLVSVTAIGCATSRHEAMSNRTADVSMVDYSIEFAEWREQKKGTGTRWRMVLEEIDDNPEAPWAGNYYAGDGLGFNLYLALAPVGGFVYEVCGCLGRYDQNLGAVTPAPEGRLLLRRDLPIMQEGMPRAGAPEYVFIQWGQRRYLISPAELEAFRRAVARGEEPRRRLHGRFLLAMNDHTKPADGTPYIPLAP